MLVSFINKKSSSTTVKIQLSRQIKVTAQHKKATDPTTENPICFGELDYNQSNN